MPSLLRTIGRLVQNYTVSRRTTRCTCGPRRKGRPTVGPGWASSGRTNHYYNCVSTQLIGLLQTGPGCREDQVLPAGREGRGAGGGPQLPRHRPPVCRGPRLLRLHVRACVVQAHHAGHGAQADLYAVLDKASTLQSNTQRPLLRLPFDC